MTEENKWLIPVGKPLQSNHVVFQEISPIEGIAHKTVGGVNYMKDGGVEFWKMEDGKKVVYGLATE